MKFARNLSVGEKFRTAYPEQRSCNQKLMPRECVFVVTKVYSQSPNYVIATRVGFPNTIYSITPTTPVLSPKELPPPTSQVLKFVSPGSRRRIVGYRLNWDGKSNLSLILSPIGAAVVKLMFATGKTEFNNKELAEAIDRQIEKFLGKRPKLSAKMIAATYSVQLRSKGLIEEIVEHVALKADVDANIA